MFESKYGKVLTIGLVILIVVVIGALIFFTVDYIKNSNINDDASNAAERFEGEVTKNNIQENTQTNTQTNTEIVAPNIQVENIIVADPSGESKNTYKGFEVAGTIEIPKIDLRYPVLENSSKSAIEASVAINSGVGLNKVGNTVIIGHNYRNGTFFSNNKNLSEGDKVYITDNTGNRVEYTIYNIYTTTPEDSDYMDRETNEKREITLVTCTDDTKSRLIIYASAD